MTTTLIRFGSMRAVMFDVVIRPPSGETIVLEVALRTCLPVTIHFISAGGLEFPVVHVRGTTSPTFASVGPVIVTRAGETKTYRQLKF